MDFKDGEKALLLDHFQTPDLMQQKFKSQTFIDYVPNGCYGFYLLGLINEAK